LEKLDRVKDTSLVQKISMEQHTETSKEWLENPNYLLIRDIWWLKF
jgi:hypothetical protein